MDKGIVEAVATAGLEDLVGHFLPRQRVWCKDRKTWGVVRQWSLVRSLMDYILVSDQQIFQNVAVRDPRHNSDHIMVLGRVTARDVLFALFLWYVEKLF